MSRYRETSLHTKRNSHIYIRSDEIYCDATAKYLRELFSCVPSLISATKSIAVDVSMYPRAKLLSPAPSMKMNQTMQPNYVAGWSANSLNRASNGIEMKDKKGKGDYKCIVVQMYFAHLPAFTRSASRGFSRRKDDIPGLPFPPGRPTSQMRF